jgi:hypothetical protein
MSVYTDAITAISGGLPENRKTPQNAAEHAISNQGNEKKMSVATKRILKFGTH